MLKIIVAVAIFALPAWGKAGTGETISGYIQMKDADSAFVDGKEIRLQGVDAPEWSQECTLGVNTKWMAGQEATAWAKSFVANKWASCAVETRDRYGRYVATCMVDGWDLNEALVRAGWAFAYTRYSDRYVDAEYAARDEKAGIWAGKCIFPEDWRHQKN